LGKSPEDVADEILVRVREQEGEGGVVVLCGLSGTGKVSLIPDFFANISFIGT
jgi:putative ribosome biogenesis GTPase RsgA